MKIRIEKVKRTQLDLSEEQPASYYPSLSEMEKESGCQFIAPVTSQLTAIWDVLATIAVLGIITALGYLSRYVFGRYFGGLAERFIQGIPGVNTVYNTVKQIVDTFSTQHRSLFTKVVLVEFPRKGVYTIGFLTNKARGDLQSKVSEELWSVFVPTTPNPTSGFLLMLPKQEIIELDMSVGDGMKMIISGGTVVPPSSGSSRPPLTVPSLSPLPGGGESRK